jgi:opacity protein-like surface antigen
MQSDLGKRLTVRGQATTQKAVWKFNKMIRRNMKRMHGLIAGACVGAFISAWPVKAAGPYFKAEAGPTIVEDVTIEEFLGAPAGQKIDFDPGFRFSIGGGYAFTDFLAVGGETGMSYNYIDDISGAVSEGDSAMGNVPLLGNVIFKFPNPTGLVPFAGAGAGISFTFFHADDLVNNEPGNDFVLDGGESDAVFAWQLFAGLKYELNNHMSFGLVYKYLNTGEAEWEAEDVLTGLDTDFRISRMKTHAVMFTFTLRF